MSGWNFWPTLRVRSAEKISPEDTSNPSPSTGSTKSSNNPPAPTYPPIPETTYRQSPRELIKFFDNHFDRLEPHQYVWRPEQLRVTITANPSYADTHPLRIFLEVSSEPRGGWVPVRMEIQTGLSGGYQWIKASPLTLRMLGHQIDRKTSLPCRDETPEPVEEMKALGCSNLRHLIHHDVVKAMESKVETKKAVPPGTVDQLAAKPLKGTDEYRDTLECLQGFLTSFFQSKNAHRYQWNQDSSVDVWIARDPAYGDSEDIQIRFKSRSLINPNWHGWYPDAIKISATNPDGSKKSLTASPVTLTYLEYELDVQTGHPNPMPKPLEHMSAIHCSNFYQLVAYEVREYDRSQKTPETAKVKNTTDTWVKIAPTDIRPGDELMQEPDGTVRRRVESSEVPEPVKTETPPKAVSAPDAISKAVDRTSKAYRGSREVLEHFLGNFFPNRSLQYVWNDDGSAHVSITPDRKYADSKGLRIHFATRTDHKGGWFPNIIRIYRGGAADDTVYASLLTHQYLAYELDYQTDNPWKVNKPIQEMAAVNCSCFRELVDRDVRLAVPARAESKTTLVAEKPTASKTSVCKLPLSREERETPEMLKKFIRHFFGSNKAYEFLSGGAGTDQTLLVKIPITYGGTFELLIEFNHKRPSGGWYPLLIKILLADESKDESPKKWLVASVLAHQYLAHECDQYTQHPDPTPTPYDRMAEMRCTSLFGLLQNDIVVNVALRQQELENKALRQAVDKSLEQDPAQNKPVPWTVDTLVEALKKIYSRDVSVLLGTATQLRILVSGDHLTTPLYLDFRPTMRGWSLIQVWYGGDNCQKNLTLPAAYTNLVQLRLDREAGFENKIQFPIGPFREPYLYSLSDAAAFAASIDYGKVIPTKAKTIPCVPQVKFVPWTPQTLEDALRLIYPGRKVTRCMNDSDTTLTYIVSGVLNGPYRTPALRVKFLSSSFDDKPRRGWWLASVRHVAIGKDPETDSIRVHRDYERLLQIRLDQNSNFQGSTLSLEGTMYSENDLSDLEGALIKVLQTSPSNEIRAMVEAPQKTVEEMTDSELRSELKLAAANDETAQKVETVSVPAPPKEFVKWNPQTLGDALRRIYQGRQVFQCPSNSENTLIYTISGMPRQMPALRIRFYRSFEDKTKRGWWLETVRYFSAGTDHEKDSMLIDNDYAKLLQIRLDRDSNYAHSELSLKGTIFGESDLAYMTDAMYKAIKSSSPRTFLTCLDISEALSELFQVKFVTSGSEDRPQVFYENSGKNVSLLPSIGFSLRNDPLMGYVISYAAITDRRRQTKPLGEGFVQYIQRKVEAIRRIPKQPMVETSPSYGDHALLQPVLWQEIERLGIEV